MCRICEYELASVLSKVIVSQTALRSPNPLAAFDGHFEAGKEENGKKRRGKGKDEKGRKGLETTPPPRK